jgi:hypothetical protein
VTQGRERQQKGEAGRSTYIDKPGAEAGAKAGARAKTRAVQGRDWGGKYKYQADHSSGGECCWVLL